MWINLNATLEEIQIDVRMRCCRASIGSGGFAERAASQASLF